MKTFTFNLGSTKFVGDYYNEIVDIINKFNYVKIIAPTECGKTEFVKRFAYNNKVNIIQPTNAICINKFQDDYSQKYYDRYGCSPKFNSINIVGTQTGVFELNCETSNVMVVDQAVKHINEFNNSIVFLDECHSVNEGTYRKSYLSLIKKLKSLDCKLITMTGTPNNEEMFIGEPDVIIYMTTENRTQVDLISCFWNQVGINIRHILETTNYDHYLIYTNHHFKRISNNIKDYSPVLIHNEFKNKNTEKHFDDIVDKGDMKDYSVIMFTQLMVSGVDLLYDKPTNLICVVQDGDIDCASVLQALGRIRKRGLQHYNIHYTIFVVKPPEKSDDTLTSEETLLIKSKCSEFDFLKIQNENYIEWDGNKYVINLEFYKMVKQMEDNIKGYKEDLLLKLKENGYKVNLLKHFDIDRKMKDLKESHIADNKMFTANANDIASIIDNDKYYDYFVSTQEEPKYEDNIVYCNSPAYIKQCAKLYKKIKERSSNKIDLSGCGDLSLCKLEDIKLFLRLSNSINFEQFINMSEGDFKLKYREIIPEKTMDRLWNRILTYKGVADRYEKVELENNEEPIGWFEFIPIVFDDTKIVSIKRKSVGSKGGKKGGKKNHTKEMFISHNNMPIEHFDSKKDVAEYLNVSTKTLDRNKELLNYEDGCFCLEEQNGFKLI